MTLAHRFTLPALLLLSAAGLAACTIEFIDQDHTHQPGPGACGDGDLDADEVCDDGNTTSGDGCSALCDSTEPCGDGIVTVAFGEVCDDGNHVAGDGCSPDCRSTETCGNGIVDTQLPMAPPDPSCLSTFIVGTGCAEVCDDGNNVSGDGCSANCLSDETCGNGIIDVLAAEMCDDGNTNDTDTCPNDCMPGATLCGNGVVDPGEQCDPGFLASGLCDVDCTTALCGDGLVNTVAGEQCDDGNFIDGDGCNNSCMLP